MFQVDSYSRQKPIRNVCSLRKTGRGGDDRNWENYTAYKYGNPHQRTLTKVILWPSRKVIRCFGQSDQTIRGPSDDSEREHLKHKDFKLDRMKTKVFWLQLVVIHAFQSTILTQHWGWRLLTTVQEAEFGHLESRRFTKAVPAETTKRNLHK